MRALVLLLTLTACAQPLPAYRPVAVPMPVAVPCQPPAIAPPNDPPLPPPGAPLFDKVKALLIDRDLHAGYEARLQAALRACE